MRHLTVAICIGALLWMPTIARAQAPTTSAPKSSKSSVKVEMVPSLFVMNAHGASLQGQTLTLAGVSPTSIVFADRPVRAAGHLPTEALLDEWTTGDFAKDAPNATVSVLSKDGVSAHDVVVELRSPRLEGDRLTFDVRVLEGTWQGQTDRPRSLSTLSACRSRRCRLRASPGARRDEPIGMAPLRRRTTGLTDIRATTRHRPTVRIPTHIDGLNSYEVVANPV
jgi:hypothetical protein